MRCRQCEETIAGTGCTRNGVCGKDSELAELQDTLIGKLIDLSVSLGKKDGDILFTLH